MEAERGEGRVVGVPSYQEEQSEDCVLASIVWDDGSHFDNIGVAFVRRRDAAFLYRQLPEEMRGYWQGNRRDSLVGSERMKAIFRLINDMLPRLRFCVDPVFRPTTLAERSEPVWLPGVVRYVGRGRVGVDVGEFSIPADGGTVTTESMPLAGQPEEWIIVDRPARAFGQAVLRWLRLCTGRKVMDGGGKA